MTYKTYMKRLGLLSSSTRQHKVSKIQPSSTNNYKISDEFLHTKYQQVNQRKSKKDQSHDHYSIFLEGNTALKYVLNRFLDNRVGR